MNSDTTARDSSAAMVVLCPTKFTVPAAVTCLTRLFNRRRQLSSGSRSRPAGGRSIDDDRPSEERVLPNALKRIELKKGLKAETNRAVVSFFPAEKMFNPMAQARSVPAAINFACRIGLHDLNLFTALGEAPLPAAAFAEFSAALQRGRTLFQIGSPQTAASSL